MSHAASSRPPLLAATLVGAACLLAGCGGDDGQDPAMLALLEPAPGVAQILVRSNSGLPSYANAPLGSDVRSMTTALDTFVAGVPFVLLLWTGPGNTFVDTGIDAHLDPDIDLSAPQDGHDRGGGNEATVTLRMDVQLGPDSSLPGTGDVPYSSLPAFDGANEREILEAAARVGIPMEEIALPAGFNLAVYLNRNILTSTEFGQASPDGRNQDHTIILGWQPSPQQLIQVSDVGHTVTLDASVRYANSPVGVTSASLPVVGAQGPSLNLRIRSGSMLPSVADAPVAVDVRDDTMPIAQIAAGLPYVLELEVVPGSAGFDLHRDPEWVSQSPPQSGLVRGGGEELTVRLVADQQLGPVSNLPVTGLPPYDMLPLFTGNNERQIIDAAVAAGIDPFSVSLPAGFNLAVFLNRNILTSDFAGTPSLDTRNDVVVVLTSMQAEIGAVATAALTGQTISFSASVTDRSGLTATDAAALGVTVPVPPAVRLSVREQSARPSLADAPLASDILSESQTLTTVGVNAPFNLFLDVSPGSAGIDFHRDPEWQASAPPQSGTARGGGNELRVSLVADRQLGSNATLPGAGAPPYDLLPLFTGANERTIVESAIAMGIDPTTIALPAGFNLAVLLNRNVLTSDAAGNPSTDSRNPATSFLADHQIGLEQAADGALLGDIITFTATVEDILSSLATDTVFVTVVPATPPLVDLRLWSDSGLASLADAPVVDDVEAASTDLLGAIVAETPFTILADVEPGDGRVDAHLQPEFVIQTPPQDGLDRGGGNGVNVQLTCSLQLGPDDNLPATGVAPYDGLPAYDGSNERAIFDAAVAAGVDPTTVSLPAGFNLAVLLNRNILTTDAVGVPSPDSRLPSMSFTLAYGVTLTQGFDATLVGSTATFTLQVTDEIGQVGTTTALLMIQ